MFQNIKVDIVYYKTNTDFELEFNLCGCCRMRLLTDKASDKKTLVQHLARAVSRSSVILIAGNLFGENGIMEIVASSIGKNLSEINSKDYGINSDEKISIINGSTPLVTQDGIFGGCIIESGPQSMVLLSENRNVRKSIMTFLIHPYIEELCSVEYKNRAESVQTNTNSLVEPEKTEDVDIASESEDQSNETATDTISPDEKEIDNDTNNEESANLTPEAENSSDIKTDTAQSITTDDNKIDSVITAVKEKVDKEEPKPLNAFATSIAPEKEQDVTLTGGMTFDGENTKNTTIKNSSDDDFFFEPEKIKKGNQNFYNQRYINSSNIDNSYILNKENDSKNSKKPFGLNLPIFIIAIILLITLIILCYCIFYIPTKSGMSSSKYLQDIFNTLFK